MAKRRPRQRNSKRPTPSTGPPSRRPSGSTPSGQLTRRDLALLFNVNMMTVTKWEQAGMPVAHRGGKGRPSLYQPGEVRAWLQQRDAAAAPAGASGAVDLVKERARKERAQALEAEQRVAIKAREYLPVADVERAWAFEVQAVRTAILATYTTRADQLHRIAVTEGVAGVEAFLKELAHDLLRELASPGREVPVAPKGTAA